MFWIWKKRNEKSNKSKNKKFIDLKKRLPRMTIQNKEGKKPESIENFMMKKVQGKYQK